MHARGLHVRGQALELEFVPSEVPVPIGHSSNAAFEFIIGTSKNDTLRGNSLNNVLIGGAGNDSLLGFGGRDMRD